MRLKSVNMGWKKNKNMVDDATSSLSNTNLKSSLKKNVIPISSIADLGNAISEIQNQLCLLIGKSEGEVSSELKALMEGYINKANESVELKVKLESLNGLSEELKTEIARLRETNRNLIHELQNAREILKNLEVEFNTLQASSKKAEQEYKEKIKELKNQNEEYENISNQREDEMTQIKLEHENSRQELLDQNFKYRQNEQELIIQLDNFKKQVEEFEILLKEQKEEIEFKTKEIEYKDALLNQLIKQATTEKLNDKVKIQDKEFDLPNVLLDKNQNKKKNWFF